MRSPPCRDLSPQLSAFVDGELRSSERIPVEEHLASCDICAGQVADLRAQSGLIRLGLELRADEVDWREFTKSVMARVTPARLPWAERWRVVAAEIFTYRRGALAAVAVAAALVVLAPVLLGRRATDGYGGEKLAVRSVSTNPDAHVAPVVMAGEHGNAIIWLVSHKHVLEGKPAPDVAQEKVDGGAGVPLKVNQERKRGGEL